MFTTPFISRVEVKTPNIVQKYRNLHQIIVCETKQNKINMTEVVKKITDKLGPHPSSCTMNQSILLVSFLHLHIPHSEQFSKIWNSPFFSNGHILVFVQLLYTRLHCTKLSNFLLTKLLLPLLDNAHVGAGW